MVIVINEKRGNIFEHRQGSSDADGFDPLKVVSLCTEAHISLQAASTNILFICGTEMQIEWYEARAASSEREGEEEEKGQAEERAWRFGGC